MPNKEILTNCGVLITKENDYNTSGQILDISSYSSTQKINFNQDDEFEPITQEDQAKLYQKIFNR